MSETAPKVMVLIPCFREGERIAFVAGESVSQGFHTVVVDDGSDDDTASAAEAVGATVIRHEVNKGKGPAVATGLAYAVGNDYDAVVMLDGDGQHLPSEISKFIEKFAETDADFIIGTRMADTSKMPFVRRITNRFMSWLLSRQIGHRISDTQCGFRLISKCAIPVALNCSSGGFSAESEILLQLALAGYKMCEVNVSTVYGSEKSKIRPVRDTVKFIKMLRHFRSQRRKLKSAGKRKSH